MTRTYSLGELETNENEMITKSQLNNIGLNGDSFGRGGGYRIGTNSNK